MQQSTVNLYDAPNKKVSQYKAQNGGLGMLHLLNSLRDLVTRREGKRVSDSGKPAGWGLLLQLVRRHVVVGLA